MKRVYNYMILLYFLGFDGVVGAAEPSPLYMLGNISPLLSLIAPRIIFITPKSALIFYTNFLTIAQISSELTDLISLHLICGRLFATEAGTINAKSVWQGGGEMKILKNRKGQSATEYMLIIAIVVLGLVAAASRLIPIFQQGVQSLGANILDTMKTTHSYEK